MASQKEQPNTHTQMNPKQKPTTEHTTNINPASEPARKKKTKGGQTRVHKHKEPNNKTPPSPQKKQQQATHHQANGPKQRIHTTEPANKRSQTTGIQHEPNHRIQHQ